MEPTFRYHSDGSVVLKDTKAASDVRLERREERYVPPAPNFDVRKKALQEIREANGDDSNSKDLLGFYRIQFGQFRGETFKWILENSPGYAGYLVKSMAKDKPGTDARWMNKMAFKKYVEMISEGREAIARKSGSHKPHVGKTAMTSEVEKQTATSVKIHTTATDVMSDADDLEMVTLIDQMDQNIEAVILRPRKNGFVSSYICLFATRKRL